MVQEREKRSMAISNALVVDDSRLARLTLTKLLEKRRIDVEKVASAREAFETLKTISPDVILMDVTMPDIDGLEATRMITKNPETSRIPVVMCTAEDTSEARDRALECGATAFLTKPAGDENLDRVLEEISEQLAKAENPPEVSLAPQDAANEPSPAVPELAPTPVPADQARAAFEDFVPRIEQISSATARDTAASAAEKLAESLREEFRATAAQAASKVARQAALDVLEANRKEDTGNLDKALVREVAESVASEIAQREAAQITADFGSAIRGEFEEQIKKLLNSDSFKKRIASSVSKPVAKGPDPVALQKLAADVAERTSESIVRELTGELARGEAREAATGVVQEHLRALQQEDSGKATAKDLQASRRLARWSMMTALIAVAGAGAAVYLVFSGTLL